MAEDEGKESSKDAHRQMLKRLKTTHGTSNRARFAEKPRKKRAKTTPERSESSGNDKEKKSEPEVIQEEDEPLGLDDDDEAENNGNDESFTKCFQTDVTDDQLKSGVERRGALRIWNGDLEFDPKPTILCSSSFPDVLEDAYARAIRSLRPRKKIVEKWKSLSIARDSEGSNLQLQDLLLYLASLYVDVQFACRDHTNAELIRQVYCLHALNHVYKTRELIIRNGQKLALGTIEEARDQGYTRPKVLILLPFRNSAYKVVNQIIDLVPESNKVGGISLKVRLEEQYAPPDQTPSKLQRPADYHEVFDGNVDDCFHLGMTFTKKSIKLFTDLYKSDILIASPLGLRMAIEGEGSRGKDQDFLSSIELLILDQADVFLMQNWEHVQIVLDSLNLTPLHPHDTDFSRVRNWSLNGWSKNYRQTMVFSSCNAPELTHIITRSSSNYRGVVKCLPADKGSISCVVPHIRQVFRRLDCGSIESVGDTHFEHVCKQAISKIVLSGAEGILLFVSSYFDFVRVRNFLKSEDASFAACSEYSKSTDITRARTLFFQRKVKLLLISERFHFFRRYRLRGVQSVLFYSLPIYPHFYPEIVNMISVSGDSECLVFYTQFDALRLNAIVGAVRSHRMLQSVRDTHLFSS